MEDEDIQSYIHQAHAIIAAKLTKKQRSELGLETSTTHLS
jgi:predicted DNA-binding protein (MmcQ/YjbR family)